MLGITFVLLCPILFFMWLDSRIDFSSYPEESTFGERNYRVHDFQAISIAAIEVWSLLALKKIWISGKQVEYSKFVRNILLQSDQMKVRDDKKLLAGNECEEV